MEPILVNMAALSVAVIFYTWRSYHQVALRKQALLRQRVAYMLWCAADHVRDRTEPVGVE